MAKINLIENNGSINMALFMLCEAIGDERKDFMGITPDSNGFYDLNITLNGKELNVERFLENLNRSYNEAVKKHAANLLSLEYDKMLNNIHEIQEALEHHNKLFEDKVYL